MKIIISKPLVLMTIDFSKYHDREKSIRELLSGLAYDGVFFARSEKVSDIKFLQILEEISADRGHIGSRYKLVVTLSDIYTTDPNERYLVDLSDHWDLEGIDIINRPYLPVAEELNGYESDYDYVEDSSYTNREVELSEYYKRESLFDKYNTVEWLDTNVSFLKFSISLLNEYFNTFCEDALSSKGVMEKGKTYFDALAPSILLYENYQEIMDFYSRDSVHYRYVFKNFWIFEICTLSAEAEKTDSPDFFNNRLTKLFDELCSDWPSVWNEYLGHKNSSSITPSDESFWKPILLILLFNV